MLLKAGDHEDDDHILSRGSSALLPRINHKINNRKYIRHCLRELGSNQHKKIKTMPTSLRPAPSLHTGSDDKPVFKNLALIRNSHRSAVLAGGLGLH